MTRQREGRYIAWRLHYLYMLGSQALDFYGNTGAQVASWRVAEDVASASGNCLRRKLTSRSMKPEQEQSNSCAQQSHHIIDTIYLTVYAVGMIVIEFQAFEQIAAPSLLVDV